jgi:hypothetical protein
LPVLCDPRRGLEQAQIRRAQLEPAQLPRLEADPRRQQRGRPIERSQRQQPQLARVRKRGKTAGQRERLVQLAAVLGVFPPA